MNVSEHNVNEIEFKIFKCLVHKRSILYINKVNSSKLQGNFGYINKFSATFCHPSIIKIRYRRKKVAFHLIE